MSDFDYDEDDDGGDYEQTRTYDGWPLEYDAYEGGEDYWDVMDWVNEQPWHYRLFWHLRNRRDVFLSRVKGCLLTCPDCHRRRKDCECIPF